MDTGSGGYRRSEADRAAAPQGECAQDQQKTSRQQPHGRNLPRLSAPNNRLHKGVVMTGRMKGMRESYIFSDNGTSRSSDAGGRGGSIVVRRSWAYSSFMPMVSLFGLGIGLSPLLQWIMVPTLNGTTKW
jgi:hypothetical protein